MKRFYTHYEKWECWKNGMYEDSLCDKKISQSIDLLSDCTRFFHVMENMSLIWVNSAMQHLSNPAINRRAYLGRSACCFDHNSNIECVRVAWNTLSNREQSQANRCAQNFIIKFVSKHNEVKQLNLFTHKEFKNAKELFREKRIPGR